MPDKDLTIKLNIDNSQAKAGAAEQVAAEREVEAAAGKAAAAIEAGAKKGAAAHVKGAGTARDAMGRFLKAGEAGAQQMARSQVDAANRAAGAYRKMGADGAKGFGLMAAAMPVVALGLQRLIGLAGEYAAAVEKAQSRSRELAQGFGDQRGKLRDLAQVEGKPLTNQFTKDFANYGAQTGMKADEALAFRSSLANANMQYVGKNISEKENDQLRVQAGQLAVARGLEPGVAGDLAGRISGTKDWQKEHGDRASEEITGATNTVAEILGRGQGENQSMVRQTAEVLGNYKDPEKAATLTSIMAQRNPEDAGMHARSTIRALADFDDKESGPLLKEAGIRPGEDPIEALKKLNPVARRNAATAGVPLSTYLGQKFGDVRAAEGITTGLDEGVQAGGFADREAVAAKYRGAAPAQRLVETFNASEEGRQRAADAKLNESQMKRGAVNSGLETLRTQALAKLSDPDRPGGPGIDTTDTEVRKMLSGAGSFGLLKEDHQRTVDVEVQRMLRERAPKGADVGSRYMGMDEKQGESTILEHATDRLPYRAENREATLRRYVDEIEKKKGDAYSDVGRARQIEAAPAGPGPQAAIDASDLKRAAGALQDAAGALKGAAMRPDGGTTVASAMPPRPGPAEYARA